MLLCLDIGNTSIAACVFRGDKIVRRFRVLTRDHKNLASALGKGITACAVSSVAPAATQPVLRIVEKTCGVKPFVLETGAQTQLKGAYKTLGSDRIAACLGAMRLFPRENLIVVDMGTATTFAALGRDGRFIGGAIMPGIATVKAGFEALIPRLPRVAITRPKSGPARTTEENLKTGYYTGHLGAVREIAATLKRAAFKTKKTLVIATGGYATTFGREKIFDAIHPDLIFHGLRIIYTDVQKKRRT